MTVPPTALLCQSNDVPYVTLDDTMPFIDAGSTRLQLLQVNIESGLWVVRMQFSAGTTVQTHKHTGEIYAFTASGSWYYLEYPQDINIAGSYLFEPAGSTHTLHVPADNTEDTEVCFVINGANLNLNAQGEVDSVTDAGGILEAYYELCEAHGFPPPTVIGAP